MWLNELITTVPDVIWSGVIASTLTLGGVLLSNVSNTKRLKIQLKHDSLEKQKERISTLRRDAYLRVAEDMTKAFGLLGALPQADFNSTSIAPEFQNLFASSAKLQLVAEPKTALLVSELSGAYGELLFKLLTKTIPMQDARIDININDEHYKLAQAEVTRVISEIKKLVESLSTTQEILTVLNNAFEFHSSQAKIFAEARDEAWTRYNKLQLEFCRALYPEMREIIEKQNTVTIEIRKDLGLTAEIEDFKAQSHAQLVKMESALNNALDELEKKLNASALNDSEGAH